MPNHPEYAVAHILLKTGCVTLSPEKPYTYKSGIISPVYCDNRRLLSFIGERSIVKGLLANRTKDLMGTDGLCGIATGSIAWAALVAYELALPMGYARSEAKGHGKGCRVEGDFKQGQRIQIIEDLVTTGGSSLDAVYAVRGMGCVVPRCVAIFSYALAESKDAFDKAGCELDALTSFPFLIREAKETGKISDSQLELLTDWHSDPKGWAGRHGFEKKEG